MLWFTPFFLLGLLAMGAAAANAAPAATAAIAAPYDLQELRHTAFHPENGTPTDIQSMVQTLDGFLWIATSSGLYRFDGARFDMELSNRLPSPSVRALFAEADGSLWIGYIFGGASVLRNGQLRNVTGGQLPPGTVKQFFRSSDGALWIATSTGLAKLESDQWHLMDAHADYSGESPEWLGAAGQRFVVVTPSATFFYLPASGHFERHPRSEGEAIRYGIPGGLAWRPDLTNTSEEEANQAMVDRMGSLWLSGYRSLLRYRWSAGLNAPPREDRFTIEMGLTGDVGSMLEDREGNVWVGTDKGLDRFSTPKLRHVAFPDGAFHPLLIPGEDGGLWVASTHHPIIRLTGDRAPIPELGVASSAAFRAPGGALWVAGRAGIFEYAQGAVAKKLPLPVTVAEVPDLFTPIPGFQAIAVDADGAVWLSVIHAGVFRWFRNGWTRADRLYQLPAGPALRMRVDARHRLWMAYPKNQVAVIEGSNSRIYGAADGLDVGNVLALDVEATHAWVAGDHGLAVLIGTRFIPVRGRADVDFRQSSGVIETAAGELWLNAARGIYRIPAASVGSLLAGSPRTLEFELFDSLDGLDSAVEVLRPGPSLLQTQDGRLWFSRREGVWSIDPAHIVRNLVAPIVSVEDLVCSGIRYPAGAVVSLPTSSRNLRIDYTAVSLTHPERMRFHYRLVGVDEGWQEAGQRRQAYYTNLSPGAYEFQVMGANEDGVWSTTSAVLRFSVRPMLYQRPAFKVAAGVLLLLIIALLFMLRLDQVQRRYRQSMDARHAERERIARDIHDTLLQGVQALLFRLQLWVEDRNIPEYLRVELAEAARQTKSIVVEGRERILMMRRADAQSADLAESLAIVGNESASGQTTAFEVTTAGEAKTLTVHAREQLIDIAREAVRNAYQHARAGRIVVNVEYRKRSLAMSIADDGHGLDPADSQKLIPVTSA